MLSRGARKALRTGPGGLGSAIFRACRQKNVRAGWSLGSLGLTVIAYRPTGAGQRPGRTNVNKAQLIDAVAEKLGDKKAAAVAVDSLVDVIVRTVNKGDKVTITGFGVFEKRARAARTARNPRTGEAVKVKKTTVPAFRAGTVFKDVISGAKKLPKVAPAKSAAATARAARAGATSAPTSSRGTSRPAKTSTTRTTATKTAAKAPAKTTRVAKTTVAKAPAKTTRAAKTTAAKTTATRSTTRATTAKAPAKAAKTTAKATRAPRSAAASK